MSDMRTVLHANGILEVPTHRWKLQDHVSEVAGSATPPEHAIQAAKHGGFMKSVQCFDNHLFYVSGVEATAMDPQQRLLLECGHRAYNVHAQSHDRQNGISEDDVGIFVGIELQGAPCCLVTLP